MPIVNPIPESHDLNPVNPYGRSKLMVEQILHWCRKAYGIRSVSFRYFNVAGASKYLGESREIETHLLPLLFKAATGEREPVTVFGNDYPTPDGTPIRDYVHVLDVARAHVLALDWLPENDVAETINLGSGRSHSVLEIVHSVERATGVSVRYDVGARREGDPAFMTAAIEYAESRLGWQPVHSGIDEIVASTWEWQKQGPGGFRDPTG